MFAFKAPAGSRELTAAEISADKWYTNFDEAVAVGKASNRLVLVDFYTSWCHWCKVLRAEVFPKDEFKAMSKYFVFCEIDAEAETSLAARFSVDAYPTSVFVNGDGTLVHKLVGYKPLKDYVAEMDDARKSAGL
jgi:thiol:disulfide interchange protein